MPFERCVRFHIFSSPEPKAHKVSEGSQGELIGWSCSVVRPSSSDVHPSVVVRPQFQRSSPLKPLGQSKPNFMWRILWEGERKVT